MKNLKNCLCEECKKSPVNSVVFNHTSALTRKLTEKALCLDCIAELDNIVNWSMWTAKTV